ncbi:hypothetical protein RND81_02G174600 [Saponaria officinalis]|uniref:Uncharacterized protein n=1 Tax=Saponaria officinalis TaxID=3572 RepID=A0AAW1MVF5_SAPOF
MSHMEIITYGSDQIIDPHQHINKRRHSFTCSPFPVPPSLVQRKPRTTTCVATAATPSSPPSPPKTLTVLRTSPVTGYTPGATTNNLIEALKYSEQILWLVCNSQNGKNILFSISQGAFLKPHDYLFIDFVDICYFSRCSLYTNLASMRVNVTPTVINSVDLVLTKAFGKVRELNHGGHGKQIIEKRFVQIGFECAA